MSEKEYIIFCDESERVGDFYSNFYGGVMVPGSDYKMISAKLNRVKSSQNLTGEVKWEKVSAGPYLDKYKALVDAFFDEVALGHLKVRIMFSQNAQVPQDLSPVHIDEQYFRLYYQFIKHAFGLKYMGASGSRSDLRLYFDKLPDTAERVAQFKGYLHGIQKASGMHVRIREANITEVDSHDHVLLQCVDVVLGSMAFRLNDKHKRMPPGKRIRGKRTRAKHDLYKAILGRICQIRPNFNVGITTGKKDWNDLWRDPYRHWNFKPKGAEYDEELTKGAAKKKGPA